MRVLLGPSHELHGGIHGTLLGRPADDVEYSVRSYSIFFQHEQRLALPFSPVHDYSIAEWVRFDDETDIDLIHSARYPVASSLPWIVDADCLLMPLQVGAFFALGLHRGALPPDSSSMHRREALMLERYANPGCRAILLRTEYARSLFIDCLAQHPELGTEISDALSAKTRVVYPAATCNINQREENRKPCVLFMGRTFQDKGGHLSLDVFEQLRIKLGSVFDGIIVTEQTPSLEARCKQLDITLLPTCDRATYLSLLGRADIFFSPTLFESFGMGLVEAAAAGLAIVTSCGPGMEHIEEIFLDRTNALLISNALEVEHRVRSYANAIELLIENPQERQRLSNNATILATTGDFSLSHHNLAMARIYEECLQFSLQAHHRRALDLGPGTSTDNVFAWSERTCHWTRQRLTPPGGLRICLG